MQAISPRMVRYSAELTMKQFARPPPSGRYEIYSGLDAANQLPPEVLHSKLEVLVLTRYPSIAFREEWRWTRDYRGDRKETLNLTCAPSGALAPTSEVLHWLERDYIRGRLEHLSARMEASLPRRKRGVRHFDDAGNLGDWIRQNDESVVSFRYERPSTSNYNTSFARTVDDALRSLLFPYLPGDLLRVEYRPPVLKHIPE